MTDILFTPLRLVELETLIENSVRKVLGEIPKQKTEQKPEWKYVPIQDIFKKKICSKVTFYAHLKKGHFTLYKFGSKSFVDMEEFQKGFHGVKLSEVLPCIIPKNK